MKLAQSRLLLLCSSMTFGLAGCFWARPVPLYPQTGAPLSPEQVAAIGGYVKYVDNRDISGLGRAFEVLPGCHTLGTPLRWSAGRGTVVATTGRREFAIPMRAGYYYAVLIDEDQMKHGPLGQMSVRAYEIDLRGVIVGVFDSTSVEEVIQLCRIRNATIAPGPPSPAVGQE